MGVGTFSDRGEPGAAVDDHLYRLELPFTASAIDARNVVDRLVIAGGVDVPEASLESLGMLLDDPAVDWRPEARRIVVLATDAAPHLPGEDRYGGRRSPTSRPIS